MEMENNKKEIAIKIKEPKVKTMKQVKIKTRNNLKVKGNEIELTKQGWNVKVQEIEEQKFKNRKIMK